MASDESRQLAVAEAYWRVLGRAPDDQGLAFHVQQLVDGLSMEDLYAGLEASAEHVAKREGTASFTTTGGTIPYRLEAQDGAAHLVVRLPGISFDTAAPEPTLSLLPGLPVDCLSIGMGADRPFTPDQTEDWIVATSDLVRSQAQALDVPMTRVICVGQSYAGTMAIRVGLQSGARAVLAGAPTILGGSWMKLRLALQERPPATRVIFSRVMEASGFTGSEEETARFDRVMFDALEQSTQPCDLRIFVSREDRFFKEGELFAAKAAERRHLRASLIHADYGGHPHLQAAFWAFVPGAVAGIIAADQPS